MRLVVFWNNIYGLTEMFPLRHKTAGSIDGHLPLQPNMKANFCVSIFFSTC